MSYKTSFLFLNNLDNKPLYLCNPIRRITTNKFETINQCLLEIDEWSQRGQHYLAGYLSYEAGFPLANLPVVNEKFSSAPLIDFYVFSTTTPWVDKVSGEVCVYNFSKPEPLELYENSFNQIKDHLNQGNSYQMNYTFQNTCSSYGNNFDLFLSLYQSQKSHYAVCALLEEVDILSLSPELFFSKIADTIVTKPMKGTLPLGIENVENTLHEKLKAENLMIVDLLRNDLAKVAKPESIKVTRLMEREQYKTLQQIVSTIEATLEPQTLFSKIIKSLFPCGSITGAPKKKTMQILRNLESHSRGVYTGTIGFITPENDMQFNVAIRTLAGKQDQWSYGIGGGIVLDSKIKEEYEEANLKSRFIKHVNSNFYIFETLFYDGETIMDQEAHLLRLTQSADFFGYTYNLNSLREKLFLFSRTPKMPLRLKFILYFDGESELQKEAFEPLAAPFLVTFSSEKMNSKNIFLKHKTSNRSVYDKEYNYYRRLNFYDVLFENEKGEMTEASRHNLFIKSESKWYTPQLECGVLPGVERANFLKKHEVIDTRFTRKDVLSADEVWLTNSLRGAVRVEVTK